MLFWRRKKNQADQEEEKRDESLLHPKDEPAIEPPTESEPQISDDIKQEINTPEVQSLEEIEETPVPVHNVQDDIEEIKDASAGEAISQNEETGGWLSRLTSGLTKSSTKITQGLSDLLTKKRLDQEMLDELEEVLISADLGPKTAMKVVEDFAAGRFGKDISEEEIKAALAESIAKILGPVAQPLDIEKPENGPFVILVCGVNGAGKTTTIGKIAHHLTHKDKRSVMLAAGDTFRAAAVEQLKIWADRVHCPIVIRDIGADAASVAYEAYEKAKAEGREVLIIDTAGRLQNKANLMEELQKIVRVLKKQDENLPHAVLLVLDATTGQNAFSQVEVFKEMVNVSGLIVTKLDGTAKGGVLVGLADQFGLPVHAIGVGEQIEDLAPFVADEYAKSLLGVAME